MVLTRESRRRWGYLATILVILLFAFSLYRANEATQLQLRAQQSVNDALQALLISPDHGYAILDNKGRVVFWNQGMEELLGYYAADMVGKTLEVIMRPDVWQEHHSKYDAVMLAKEHSGKTIVIPCVALHKDGHEVSVRVTARLVVTRHQDRFTVASVDAKSQIVTIKPDYLNKEKQNAEK